MNKKDLEQLAGYHFSRSRENRKQDIDKARINMALSCFYSTLSGNTSLTRVCSKYLKDVLNLSDYGIRLYRNSVSAQVFRQSEDLLKFFIKNITDSLLKP
jgi:hypothetical protein